METLNFVTLESYVAWRNEKRAEYKTLSKNIRDKKDERRQHMQNGQYAGNIQGNLIDMRAEAKAMMEQRVEAKQIARQSWNRWQATEKVAAAA